MWTFNSVMGRVISLIFFPFRSLDPWFALVFVSFLTGLLMLFIFRLTSNQKGIRQAKDMIKAHLLELRLFKDSLPITLRAQGQILKHNFRYIGYSAKPMLIMLIPLLVILAQLNLWFGYEALRADETTILKVSLKERSAPMDLAVELKVPSGLAIETPPLRLAESGEINWRIRAKEEGSHELRIELAGQSFTKIVTAASKSLMRICPIKTSRLVDEFLYPGEKPLSPKVPVTSVEITYPARRLNFFGLNFHWLIPYLILSILFGFVFKRPFRVEI